VIGRSEIVLILLVMAPASGAMAQIIDSPISPSSGIKRNYPGGRDDSDLAVQPQKRVTKKEVESQNDEIDEGDYDQGDAASGFGE
jgi:hypothetical protein